MLIQCLPFIKAKIAFVIKQSTLRYEQVVKAILTNSSDEP